MKLFHNAAQSILSRQQTKVRTLSRKSSLCFSTSTSSSSTEATKGKVNGNKGVFGKLWDRYSVQGQQRRIEMGERLFRAAQWRAMHPAWYEGENRIPIAFKPQHALISMHVWFLHKRLAAASQTDSFNLLIDEELFESLWNDTKSRIRAVDGVHELTVNKHLKDAQQKTFLQCTHYDHAFDHEDTRHDPKKRFEVVCDSVWKHVLGGEEDASEELIKRLGLYVEYQMENILLMLPDDYFEEGRIDWGSMPDFNYQGAGSAGVNLVVQDAKGRGFEFMDEKEEWVKILTDAGDPYYWNTKSNETSWVQK